MNRLFLSKCQRLVALIVALLFIFNSSFAFAAAPSFTSWNPGDGHIHTTKSDGKSSVGKMVQTGESEGLDWHVITDHSDVTYFDRFVRKYLTNEDWAALTTDTANVGAFLGEEVTVGNGKDLKTMGHFLVYGINNRIEPFTSSTQDARRTAWDIVDEIVREQGGIGCVAHPYTSKIFGPYGERWRAWNVIDDYAYTGRIGIELINGGYQPRPMTLNRWMAI